MMTRLEGWVEEGWSWVAEEQAYQMSYSIVYSHRQQALHITNTSIPLDIRLETTYSNIFEGFHPGWSGSDRLWGIP